jgi:ADP-heptose:LPS heptosyltransferase
LSLQQSFKHIAFSALAAIDRAPSVPLSGIRNFLLLQHATALGTVLHTTPLVAALRDAVPDARIVVATSGFGLDVFRNNPGVSSVLPTSNPTQNLREAARQLRTALPLDQPFATITPVGSERSAIGLAAWIAGAGNRAGYTLTPEIFRAPLVFDAAQSLIANNLRIVEALGHVASPHREPQIFFTEEHLSQVRSLLAGTYDSNRPLAVLVTQTSPTQRKSWRIERFAAAAQHLIDKHNAQLVLVGTTVERPAIDELRQQLRGSVWNLAGQTNLLQLAALLSLCDIGLTLDTGTMHVGRAVGLPMVIIAPAWAPPLEWLPINNPRYTILKNLTLPAATDDYIIDEVSVDEVIASLDDLMRRYPRNSR